MSNEKNYDTGISTVISGSFRKHLFGIAVLKNILENEGINVLSPIGNTSVNLGEEFVILDSDPVSSPELLQSSVFAKIRKSTFLMLANFDGYIGNAAILEIGYALALGVKMFALEPVSDPNLAPYIFPIENILPDVKDDLAMKMLSNCD